MNKAHGPVHWFPGCVTSGRRVGCGGWGEGGGRESERAQRVRSWEFSGFREQALWLYTVSKETYYSVKRDLLQCQKRPTTVSKETYYTKETWEFSGFREQALWL